MNTTAARHWAATALPKAAPALATTTVLVLARVWNANGAEHSIGNALLMGSLAIGAAGAGCTTATGHRGADPVITGAAFATAGALALAGVAGYADGLALPLLLWAIATALAYGLAARHWRTDRRERTACERATAERRERHAHLERVEAIRAGAQVETARLHLDAVRESTAYAAALADALATRAALPGYDPAALTRAGLPELPRATERDS